MKKNTPRKLTIHRETLRSLENTHLHAVDGGATGWVSCGPTQWSWCGICKDTGAENE